MEQSQNEMMTDCKPAPAIFPPQGGSKDFFPHPVGKKTVRPTGGGKIVLADNDAWLSG